MKCIDRATGEEIYFNTTLPKGVGSWASEEEALKAIGTKIADEFSRDFFLQHANVTGRKVTLSVDGLPDRRVGGPAGARARRAARSHRRDGAAAGAAPRATICCSREAAPPAISSLAPC